MLIKKISIFFLISTVLILLIGCASTDNLVMDKPSGISPRLDWSVPDPSGDSGVVFGELLNATSEEPVQGTPFLSKNLSYMDPDMPATISFSFQYDPRAMGNKQTGEIYFKDVKPGENYVIMLYYGPGKSYVVRDEGGEYPLMIQVKSGESVDLGTVFVSEP